MNVATVFVVDDDEACRDSISEMVAAAGLVASLFDSGQAFLDAFDPEWIGCLVLDFRMPRMDGIALQKELLEMGARLPIIFISGSVDIPKAVEAIRAGAVDFLQKPYGQQRLLDAIHKAMALGVASRVPGSRVKEPPQVPRSMRDS